MAFISVLMSQENGPNPQEIISWVILGDDAIRAIPLRIPCTMYVSMREAQEISGWHKVSRILPHGLPPNFMYEVSTSEADFVSIAGDMGRWLKYKNAHAIYHTQYSARLRAMVQLGSICHVGRGVPRRAPSTGFDLAEIQPSAHADYLRGRDGHAQGACRLISVYAAGTAARGVLGVMAPHEQMGLFLLVRPRGTAVSEQARSSLAAHEIANELHLSLDGVDSWEAAYGRVQRLLLSMQESAKGRAVTLIQSTQPLQYLAREIPALKQAPTIEMPCSRADGVWDESLALGGAWQPAALKLALARLVEQGPWWEQRLALARCALYMVSALLPPDMSAFLPLAIRSSSHSCPPLPSHPSPRLPSQACVGTLRTQQISPS